MTMAEQPDEQLPGSQPVVVLCCGRAAARTGRPDDAHQSGEGSARTSRPDPRPEGQGQNARRFDGRRGRDQRRVRIRDEMDIDYPTAEMVIEVAEGQEDEPGDGTTTALKVYPERRRWVGL